MATKRTAVSRPKKTAAKKPKLPSYSVSLSWNGQRVGVSIDLSNLDKFGICLAKLRPRVKAAMTDAEKSAALDDAFDAFSRCLNSKR